MGSSKNSYFLFFTRWLQKHLKFVWAFSVWQALFFAAIFCRSFIIKFIYVTCCRVEFDFGWAEWWAGRLGLKWQLILSCRDTLGSFTVASRSSSLNHLKSGMNLRIKNRGDLQNHSLRFRKISSICVLIKFPGKRFLSTNFLCKFILWFLIWKYLYSRSLHSRTTEFQLNSEKTRYLRPIWGSSWQHFSTRGTPVLWQQLILAICDQTPT